MGNREDDQEAWRQRVRGQDWNRRQSSTIGYGDYDEMERDRYTGGDLENAWGSGGYLRRPPPDGGYGGYRGEFRDREGPVGRFAGKGPRGYVRSDERIREEVCELLTQSEDVDATDVEVSVHDGEVTLQGSVDDRRQRRAAGQAVEAARGVRDVHNHIRVRHELGHAPEASR